MSRTTRISVDILHYCFPTRAKELRRALLKTHRELKRMEDWRVLQIISFVEYLIAASSDIERAYRERRGATVAWIARNLLEVWVWVDYCNLSLNSAKRFLDDAQRDMNGFSASLYELDAADTGDVNIDFEKAIKMGFKKEADEFVRVSDAAQILGRRDEFVRLNKMFSKFAHPSAWLVNMLLIKRLSRFANRLFLVEGAGLAAEAFWALYDEIVKVYPEVKAKLETSATAKESPSVS